MDRWKSTFLYKLYEADKMVFLLLFLYAVGILYGLRWQKEEFPFFLYGMYSLPEPEQKNYQVNVLFLDDKIVDTENMPYAKRELIRSIMLHIPTAAGSVSEQLLKKHAMMKWLFGQLRSARSEKLELIQIKAEYNSSGHLIPTDTLKMFSYAE